MKNKILSIVIALLAVLMLFAGCGKTHVVTTSTSTNADNSVSSEAAASDATEPVTNFSKTTFDSYFEAEGNIAQFDESDIKSEYPVAMLKTSVGIVTIIIYYDAETTAAKHFMKKIADGYYDGKKFNMYDNTLGLRLKTGDADEGTDFDAASVTWAKGSNNMLFMDKIDENGKTSANDIFITFSEKKQLSFDKELVKKYVPLGYIALGTDVLYDALNNNVGDDNMLRTPIVIEKVMLDPRGAEY